MNKKINSALKILRDSKIITPIILASLATYITVFFYIPYITEKNSIKMATKHSITAVEQMKLTRAYYVDAVVKDIKKYAPNMQFSYDHKGLNNSLPLPATALHDLSRIFSDNSGIKYNLYSEYPFAFRKMRELSEFQKEAIEYTKNSDDGIYIKKDFIDDKPVLRVAVTDFMTDQACVDCHNSHPQRTWTEDKWKLGDKRGVIEVITSLEDVIESNLEARDNMLIFISIIGFVLVIYLSYILAKREKELLDANDQLQDEFINLKNETSKAITQAKEKELHMLQQSKMAQMGEMLSMIAHQWRQPLAAISSTASTLELKLIMDDYDQPVFTAGIKDIQAYSQHLSLTINDFRNFFKDSKVVTKTTFENIIDDTVQIVKTSLQDHDTILVIHNDFKDELCIYENEFKQVILNLIKNAEDAIIENGISHGLIEIKTYRHGTDAIFEVSDNARGIDVEILSKIFDPYFSTKDKKSGTGLGLYMSKTIIENHCLGSIECFNTQEGARFKITLDPNKFSLAD
ncbi:histidine kinase [Sulfurimonas gotlandica GD1]|uniref:histidine kinase n=1 Tax=Sulfurimonas gotlandica (strain DSM 19862 / JCM 16533 / GD1) TaxID=929558 RepID=H1FSE5_SULGG|nr:ATP-binding protein [Sulfurimonas gotlandica]EHP29873.1 histidine kinase [Sulfurimonas gotlandica GD1]